jgi:uncharacterized protein with NAD-binding domain and iron-sulfur cluster
VQSFPGTIQYRLDPAKPIFGNLYVAGDWTLSRINGGSVEAAIESGMRASQAICGYPKSPLPAFSPHAVDSRSATGANSSRAIACC